MFEFLTLESCTVYIYICVRLRVLRFIYAQPPSLYKLDSQVLMKFKINKRTNVKWKLEIRQF